jgi:hypothetical protein
MGLGRNHPNIANLEAKRISRIKKELIRLREEAPYSEKSKNDFEKGMMNL